MNKMNKWWMAGMGALILAAALGVGAVMAQEATPSPGATTTPQDAPAAQETPDTTTPDSGDATPDGGDADPGRGPGGCGGKLVDHEALAEFLGVDAAQLRDDLAADGATLATVAAAHGQGREALIAFLTSQAQERLAAKVADDSLTQAEADAKLAEFTANVDELIDSDAPIGRGFHRGDGDAPHSSSSDSSVS